MHARHRIATGLEQHEGHAGIADEPGRSVQRRDAVLVTIVRVGTLGEADTHRIDGGMFEELLGIPLRTRGAQGDLAGGRQAYAGDQYVTQPVHIMVLFPGDGTPMMASRQA
ncbi:MAG: hypothetical protein OXC42_07155 [Gammaproteobacteria bacterium]|nr:hypothetical protein [Gammaproteobacteria bacterium]